MDLARIQERDFFYLETYMYRSGRYIPEEKKHGIPSREDQRYA
jgi:hypothetical protein